MPRRIDRIAGAAERGTLTVNVRLLGDERDVGLVDRLVNRVRLAVVAVEILGPSP